MKKIVLFICKAVAIVVFVIATSGVALCQVQYSGTVDTGNVASAINYETQATGSYSFAAGYQSIAAGYTSTAIGTSSIAAGGHSFAIGDFCYSADQAYSFGLNAKANADQSLAIGRFVETNASGAITLGSSVSGHSLINTISSSLMIGFNSTVPTLFISESDLLPSFNGHGKVGIGTSNPVARFQVADGDIFIEDVNSGIVMKSPDGNCWRGTLDNNGQLNFIKLEDCITLSDNKIPGSLSEPAVKIYPNPASLYIDVTCSAEDAKMYSSISLISTNGETVLSFPFTSLSTKLSLTNIALGSYVLTLTGKNKCFSQKVIVE